MTRSLPSRFSNLLSKPCKWDQFSSVQSHSHARLFATPINRSTPLKNDHKESTSQHTVGDGNESDPSISVTEFTFFSSKNFTVEQKLTTSYPRKTVHVLCEYYFCYNHLVADLVWRKNFGVDLRTQVHLLRLAGFLIKVNFLGFYQHGPPGACTFRTGEQLDLILETNTHDAVNWGSR